MRAAVVGHVEWVEFAEVDRVPEPGGIAHARSVLQRPAGGGGVSAVQLRKLAGDTTLFTALGAGRLGRRSAEELRAMGVRVEPAFRSDPQRRALTMIDREHERTIVTLGDRHAARGDDPLPWDEFAGMDAVYFTAGDEGALRHARRARVLVATSRVLGVLLRARVQLDALIGSGRDSAEAYRGELRPPPRLVVTTAGRDGGRYEAAAGESGSWDAEPLPGPLVDTYGCGDSFAAGVTYALAAGMSAEAAVRFGARCGAACATGRGPYEAQLRLPQGREPIGPA
jgi:ribokinase